MISSNTISDGCELERYVRHDPVERLNAAREADERVFALAAAVTARGTTAR